MVDLGITYTQVKSADGPYIYRMEPDIDTLIQFPDFPGVSLSYFGRQLVNREVELERIHRSTPKFTSTTLNPPKPKAQLAAKITSPQSLPNHLQRLKPKRIEMSEKTKAEAVSLFILFIYLIVLCTSTKNMHTNTHINNHLTGYCKFNSIYCNRFA